MSEVGSYSQAYIDFVEECMLDMSCMGEVIGGGMNTIVVDAYNEWMGKTSINDAVLVITREPGKFNILKSIFSGTSNRVQKIKGLNDEYSDIKEFCKSEGWEIFACSRLYSAEIDSKDETIIQLREFSENYWNAQISLNDLSSLIDEFEHNLNYMEGENGDEIIRSISETLNNLKKINFNFEDNNIPYQFDIHEDQFLRDQTGQLICVDPLYHKF